MSLSVDRWFELGLAWFSPDTLEQQADLLMGRLAPLCEGVEGSKGLSLDLGMQPDILLTFEGTLEQPFPRITPRMHKWNDATFAEVAKVVALIKNKAAERGIADFKVGTYVQGGGGSTPEGHAHPLYTFNAPFNQNHPEAYENNHEGFPMLRPGAVLKGDNIRYGGFPDGIEDGMKFHDFMAGQWASFSKVLGFEQLLLRDGWYARHCYRRIGPSGTTASPDVEANARYTDELIVLFRKLKEAVPDATLGGYSWGHGAISQWRVGLGDIERLIADGAIDFWMDQTWGGAWQDWWSWEPVGWTMQVAYHTMQRAMIAKANEQRDVPCRHWNVCETWDGWEPWDTMHQVPGKLRWGMWALSHGTAVTPDGLKVADGSYMAWVNSKHEDDIWREDDVDFIKKNINAAQVDALQVEKVYGSTMVYHREPLDKLHNSTPDDQIGEWVDEQAGLLAKWGTPCLSATRMEWLPKVADQLEGLLLQNPVDLSDEVMTTIGHAIDDGHPVVLVGRADWVDESLLEKAGVQKLDKEIVPRWFQITQLKDQSDYPDRNVVHYDKLVSFEAANGEATLKGRGTDLTVRSTKQSNLMYWMPPDWFEPDNFSFRQTQFGSLASHSQLSRMINNAGRSGASISVGDVPYIEPVAVSMWKSAGKIRILVGNLETGILGDARTPRRVTIMINREHLELGSGKYLLEDMDSKEKLEPTSDDTQSLTFEFEVQPEDSRVLTIVAG